MTRPAVLALALAALASPAIADPCKRIPDRGSMPAELRQGSTFSGPVVYVGDGDSLCVQTLPGIGGAGWVEVRLADFNAPELSDPGGPDARDTLSRLTMGQTLRCRAGRRSWDRVVAHCTLGGRPVGDLMRAAGVREGGR